MTGRVPETKFSCSVFSSHPLNELVKAWAIGAYVTFCCPAHSACMIWCPAHSTRAVHDDRGIKDNMNLLLGAYWLLPLHLFASNKRLVHPKTNFFFFKDSQNLLYMHIVLNIDKNKKNIIYASSIKYRRKKLILPFIYKL
jgi:hypothetical protein